MRPVILAWQMGAGRGHIAAIKRVAIALGPMFEIDAALGSVDHAHELAGLCKYIYPCAGLTLSARAFKRSESGATWGQYLGDCGCDDVEILKNCFAWWHQTFKARNPALVVCEYAPVAQWTARAMGIPVVSVGTAFGQPPAELKTFPQILPDHNGRPHDEAQLVENINAATQPLGFKKLSRLPELYDVDCQLLASFADLDPYANHSGRSYISPVPTLDHKCFEVGHGEDVFVYFSTTETQNSSLLQALKTLDLPISAYLPGASPDIVQQLRGVGITVLDQPATPDEIKSRSRLMLHSGQHGTLSLGMALGLPQFAVPQQLEQLFHARRAANLGGLAMPYSTGVSADAFRDAIRAAYVNESLAVAAKGVQTNLQPNLPFNATIQLRNALQPFLPRGFSL